MGHQFERTILKINQELQQSQWSLDIELSISLSLAVLVSQALLLYTLIVTAIRSLLP